MSRQEFFNTVIKQISTEELARIANRLSESGAIFTELTNELASRKDYQPTGI